MPKKPTITKPKAYQFRSYKNTKKGFDERLKSARSTRDVSTTLLQFADPKYANTAVGRLLTTYLTGFTRGITEADLTAFDKSVKSVGSDYRGGITAQQVLAFSLQSRKENSERDIHVAYPVHYDKDVVTFITNASAESNHNNHRVLVKLVNFYPMIAETIKWETGMTDKQIDSKQKTLRKKQIDKIKKGKLCIDCSCEDWQYRFRYIANAGKYNINTWEETAYPKITNPLLEGVACKHILRVMLVIEQATVFAIFLEKMIAHALSSAAPPVKTLTVKENQAFTKETGKLAFKNHSKLAEQRKEKHETAAKKALQKELAAREKASIAETLKQAKPFKQKVKGTKEVKASDIKNNPDSNKVIDAIKTLRESGLTNEQIQALLQQ